ncbi:hypothetical protein QWY85_19420 [Neolewinella lacunae]|uniref:CBM20 domain-containing protein n=1 Tax=Neolewinella lacunae TaxID=1517758 RepID=A0A923T6D5_9BACT|nr:hypothetical protein [Neolewinella lacunae]MBC6993310.1 hypothetical protein [Neolewinella lacunae]MDN3636849.1 hypothetical protein [Neolewinella lacunae]
MMKKYVFYFLAFVCITTIKAQTVFHTKDIENFYLAFDSIQATTNKEKQIDFVQKIYLDNGSLGVEYAINHSIDGGKRATAKHWVDLMNNSQEHLIKIRPYFTNLSSQMKILEPKFKYFKEQYPGFKDGDVYFVMGLGMFGGRPEREGPNLFIGCELLANEKPDWAVSIVLHEYVHTLQNQSDNALLAHCLYEGACDFVSEVINQKSLVETYPGGYVGFGHSNETAVWKQFKKFIASNEKGVYFDWLYGVKGRNLNGEQVKDLGYFVGYKICKAYYDKATDKKQAIKDIIEMDVSSDEKARAFLIASGYAAKGDSKFIKNFKFEKITEVKKGLKLIQYGYKLDKENIIFTFALPKNMREEEIEYVTIAGSFNGWNPDNSNYKMTRTGTGIYQFTLRKKDLKEVYHEFKFVVNGEFWQAVPESAKNTQNGNLTLEIK